MAILYIEQTGRNIVVMDGHDSMLNEVEDTFESVLDTLKLMQRAYDRVLRFPNGFEVKIPIDFKIGYSIKGLVKCPGNLEEIGLQNIYQTLHQQQKAPPSFTGGALQAQSPQPSNETSGLTESSGNSTQTSTSSLLDVQA